VVVVDTTRSADRPAAVKQASTEISQLPDVAAVTPPKVNQAGDTALLTGHPEERPE
jgi:RND superfamily putative drug exporter